MGTRSLCVPRLHLDHGDSLQVLQFKDKPSCIVAYNLKYGYSQEAISPFLLLCPMSSCNRENKGEGPDIPPASITGSHGHERKSKEMLNVVLQTFMFS